MAFAEMVRDKKVAIVAPANDPEFDIGKIAREHDAVVICNYYKSGLTEKYKYYKYNLKVVLYSNVELTGIINIEEFQEPDFIVCKRYDNKETMEIMRTCNARMMYSFGPIMYLGVLNMVQAAILDLVQFSPSQIDVYGCNLYLEKNPYRKGWLEGYATPVKEIMRDKFSKHNTILQYIILQILYKNKMINPDNMLGNILDDGICDYLRKMEEIYSD